MVASVSCRRFSMVLAVGVPLNGGHGESNASSAAAQLSARATAAR